MPGREPRKCCTRKATRKIVYDCGPNDEEMLLCDFHFLLDPVFQKNIKHVEKIEEIKN